MSPQYIVFIAAGAVGLAMVGCMILILSRYTRVGPNQVLVVSGRKVQLPDGRIVGHRIVKGGGTFVMPILEKAEVLSLEVFTMEIPRLRLATADRRAVESGCLAQAKINSDDAAIAAAAEFFLGKRPEAIKAIVQPVLERHLNGVLGSLSADELLQNPAASAVRVQAAAAGDLGKMGLALLSLTLRPTGV